MRQAGVRRGCCREERCTKNYTPSIMMIGHSYAQANIGMRSQDALSSA